MTLPLPPSHRSRSTPCLSHQMVQFGTGLWEDALPAARSAVVSAYCLWYANETAIWSHKALLICFLLLKFQINCQIFTKFGTSFVPFALTNFKEYFAQFIFLPVGFQHERKMFKLYRCVFVRRRARCCYSLKMAVSLTLQIIQMHKNGRRSQRLV